MKVIVVEPMKAPVVKDIGNKLEDMQAVVDGPIEAIYPFEDEVAIVCNEEGKLTGKRANRCLRSPTDYSYIMDILCGTFFICGLGEEDFTDIPEALEAKYIDMFECTEEFRKIGNSIFLTAYKGDKCVKFMREIFPGRRRPRK